MVTRKDYSPPDVIAARSVLIELMHILGEHKKNIVLIGGWVPELLISKPAFPHVGSIDVDIALDHRNITGSGYRSICQKLLKRGYRQGKQPFIFIREVTVKDRPIQVQVDLLAAEYGGTGKGRRHQRIDDILARKVRGCDLAFEMYEKVKIEGEIPGGGIDRVEVRVASLVPFFVMKGMAMDDRLKEKDFYDIYYCLRHYPGGIDTLAAEFKPVLNKKLVLEGLQKIAKYFESETHIGPKFVADFEEIIDPEERNLIQRDAFERLHMLLLKLSFEKK
jgi:hypothetical protein